MASLGTSPAYPTAPRSGRRRPRLTEAVALQRVYTGSPIPTGRKAVALRLTFRAEGRTLTDADVDAQMAAVDALLTERAHAERR